MTRVHLRITRDTVTYLVGLAGTGYVTVFMSGSPLERAPLLTIFVGLLVTPAALRKGDRKPPTGEEPPG